MIPNPELTAALAKFLEEDPLYRRAPIRLGSKEPFLSVSLHVSCDSEACRGEVRTFTCAHDDWKRTASIPRTLSSSSGAYVRNPLDYGAREITQVSFACAACNSRRRHFFLLNHGDALEKIGQWPGFDISVDRELAKSLGDASKLFRSGRLCEVNGFGIGASAYYRRVVEDIIAKLLDDLADLVPGNERPEYDAALATVRQSHRAEEKIAAVKELVPAQLRPGGMNPLGILFKHLSEDIHVLSDADALAHAAEIRVALSFLSTEIWRQRSASLSFNESMKALLARHTSSGETNGANVAKRGKQKGR